MFLFQLFKRIWPTRSSHSKYLNLFDSVPYSEKLMGRPPTIFFSSPKRCLAETFEMFYGGNREAGRAVVNSYCKAKHHLQVPKPEQLLLPKPDLSLNLPPLKMPPQPNACVPVQKVLCIHMYLLRLPRWRAQRGGCDIALLRSAFPLPSFKVAGIKCSAWGGSEEEDSRL